MNGYNGHIKIQIERINSGEVVMCYGKNDPIKYDYRT
jgi:hypothetical protein